MASKGGAVLVAGAFFLLMTGFVASPPGYLWPIFLLSLGINLIGLFVAKGVARRLIAVLLTGFSGGLALVDYLILH